MSTTLPTPRAGFLAGGIAMLGSLAVLRVLNVLIGSRPLAESLSDGILLLLPVDAFAWLKENLGDQAKTWLLIGIVIGFLAIGALMGGFIAAAEEAWKTRVWSASAFIFAVAVALVFFIDRSQFENRFISTSISLAVAAIVYGALTRAMLLIPTSGETFSESRRYAIGAIAGVAGALVLGRDIRTVWKHQSTTTAELAESEFTPAITPNDQFYRISKNFNDPGNDRGSNWTIEIAGNVDNPGEWNYEQLQALGTEQMISTMLCISNTVGGDLIGTAEWTGLPMATFLDEIGATGDYVYFRGDDDYETSVPMERCRGEQSWIVWGMNGEPLPTSHGAPVRAIIPGLYGMKSVKWLTKMEVTDEDRLGYWEQRNWTNTAVVKPMSRIDFPRRSTNLDEGTIPVRGIAFGGDLGLSAVEVSTDDGETWKEARITEQPNPDGIAWSMWQYDWLAEPGTHTLVVRMISADGEVQTSETAGPLPDGSSGWHKMPVVVNRA